LLGEWFTRHPHVGGGNGNTRLDLNRSFFVLYAARISRVARASTVGFTVIASELPLLPLMLDDVPLGLAQILAQAGVPFCQRVGGGGEGRFVLFDSRRGISHPPGYGQTAIDVDCLRDSTEADPFELLCGEQSRPKQWEIAGWTVTEKVAEVDRRAVRRRVLDQLREEIEQAGGVWVCVSPFPFPYRSAFNLRIDHSRYDADQFHAALLALADGERAVTHVIGGDAFEPHADALARLQGLDVGSRGYRGEVYTTERENLKNVRRGLETLRAARLNPSGFAAPGGRFHRSLLSALEKLEISHSSEVGLAYDELPFFPQASDVLQMPVHPVGFDSFLRTPSRETPPSSATQRAVHATIDYFRDTARSKYRAGEPVFFHGESTGVLVGYPQLLHAVFDTVGAFGAIWKTTLTEYADWWRARAAVRLSVVREGDHYVVHSDYHPREYRVGIEYSRGRHIARMRLKGNLLRFSPSALAYENRTSLPLVNPVRIDPPEGLRGLVRRWVEPGEKNGPNETILDSWRDRAKRAFRRLHG